MKFERSLSKTEKNSKMRQKYYIAFLKCALEMALENFELIEFFLALNGFRKNHDSFIYFRYKRDGIAIIWRKI